MSKTHCEPNGLDVNSTSYQIFIPERPGEVLHSRANNDKIKQHLGWNYNIEVLDWIKSQIKNG